MTLKTTLTTITAGLLLSAGAALAADPLEGYWRTAADDNGNSGIIHVTPCGAKLCGTLVKSYDASGQEWNSPNLGRRIISDTVNKGNGSYAGRVYSPDRNKTYNSRLKLSGTALKVSGCVLGICRDGGTWQKVK
ncbi:MAG: DUF2147 domain-containing protein [Pseudomonadota bacterium]